MTDVQQGEPSRKQTKTKQTKTKKRDRQPDKAQIKYDDKAIAKGKRLVKAFQSNQIKLGELADRLEPKYGDQTLERFAKDIGIEPATLGRIRSVYRRYKGLDLGSGASFSVRKDLQGHPAADEIIKNNPNLTRPQARTFMRDLRVAQGQDPDKGQDQGKEQEQDQAQEQDQWLDRIRHLEPQLRWKVIEAQRWLAELVNFALEAHKKYGHLSLEHIDLGVLRYAVEEPDKVVTTLRLGGLPFIAVAHKIESALTPLLPPPDSTPDQTT